MKRIVWTFGLLAGGVLAGMMALTLPFMDKIGGDKGEIIGYTTMVVAFLMVYFGVRSYRDNVRSGQIAFGHAFRVGILITLIASACYVAAWETIYYTSGSNFASQYATTELEKARAGGATEEELSAKRAEMEKFAAMYRNPLFNIGITFLEVFPVGLIMTLVSAGILSSRSSSTSREPALS